MYSQPIQRSATAEPIVLGRNSKEENYHPRTSTASRRTVASTRASAFFSNACRSPRDLTTLAARVHSPGVDGKISAHSIPSPLHAFESEPNRQKRPDQHHMQALPEWELPSLEFRPLSFEAYASEARGRPKTSGDAQEKSATQILSPMPERPMSSQSRKRFSRIFDLQESFVAEETNAISEIKTFARLSAVTEQPDLQSVKAASTIPTGSEHNSQSTVGEFSDQQLDYTNVSGHEGNASTGDITIHDKSTVESLLDHHIECLGLGGEPDSPLTFNEAGASKASREAKTPTIPSKVTSNPTLRPTTSGSCQPSSLTSSERRRLMPRRLFASMDASMAHQSILQENVQTFDKELSSAMTSRPSGLLSFGWQTLPSTSELASTQSATKISLTSGDLADIDSDLPLNKFKIRRISDMTASTAESSKQLHNLSIKLSPSRPSPTNPRSKSNLVTKQDCHRRRRARILLKAKRKSACLDPIVTDDRKSQEPVDAVPEDEWETTESPEDISMKSPVPGYAELSGESVIAQPPTTIPSESVLLSSSAPKRWTNMLAVMPEPVKKSIEIVRKASIRTVRSHRSNTSITHPLNSTRMSSQLPRSGSVPQLAPPEFGPPLTSSNLDLTLRLPGLLPGTRPPLRQAQSFFSDNSSAQHSKHIMRKRFDLHSLRSGLTGSSGILGTRGSTAQHTEVKFNPSIHVNNQRSFDNSQSFLGDTVPVTDFAFKKRKVLDRFKDWWERHACKKRGHR